MGWLAETSMPGEKGGLQRPACPGIGWLAEASMSWNRLACRGH